MSEVGNGSSGGDSGSTGAPNVSGDNTNVSSGQTDKQIAAEIKKFKVKIDGQESEVDEAELVSGYQTRKASDKAFREGQAAKKQAEQFASLLKSDFLKVLESPELGLSEDQIIDQLEQYMYKKYKFRDLPEDQQRLLKDSEELQRIRDEQNESKKRQDEEKAQALQAHYADQYSKQFVSALETSGLPKTERTIRSMVRHMTNALQNGIDVTPQEVVHLVREDYDSDYKSLYQSADPQTLIKLLGEDVVRKLVEANTSNLRSPLQEAVRNTSKPSGPGSSITKKGKAMTKQEWRDKMDRIKSGKDE